MLIALVLVSKELGPEKSGGPCLHSREGFEQRKGRGMCQRGTLSFGLEVALKELMS